MLVNKHSFIFLLIFFCCFLQQFSHAQCTTPISIFPYDENFEASDGNWVSSSNAHWEWGQIISKPVITAAGGGSKCWLAGGLSGSFYNSGSSNLVSPCFDISTVPNPEISFKIFWETERRYDGAVLQYSTDGGVSWLTLGDINSNSNCQGSNWYNYDPVNFLGGPGWSGNMQPTSGSCVGGGGSGRWLTARHSLATVGGSGNVIFRFVFAAGLTCNSFDGFAIDDIHIDETPVNTADFTYTCNAGSAVSFSSSSVGCKTAVSWNFGDTGSGANNNSTLDNPGHDFSSPGTYIITLTTNFATGPSIVIAKTVKVISATAVINTALKCNGDNNGSITVTVSPAGAYNYSWDTSPPASTPSVNNLTAATYTVTITAANTCSVSLPVALAEPAALSLTTNIADSKCGLNNGSINTSVLGGTMPYNYLWSTTAITSSINNLAAGNFSILVTDANGCNAAANNLVVKDVVNNIVVTLGADKPICPGQTILLSPGNFASYKWQDNSSASTFSASAAGTYAVTVTDNDGCTGFASVIITADCSDIYFPSAFTPGNDTRNESFGPLGNNLAAIKNYKLVVYGRWGEVIFSSTDPYKKWDGTYKGKLQQTQVFVWIATYSLNNFLPVTQKGTLTIIH